MGAAGSSSGAGGMPPATGTSGFMPSGGASGKGPSTSPWMNVYNPGSYNSSGKGPGTSSSYTPYNYFQNGPVSGPTDPNSIQSSATAPPQYAPPAPYVPTPPPPIDYSNIYTGFARGGAAKGITAKQLSALLQALKQSIKE